VEADAGGERSPSLSGRLVRIALWIGAVAAVLVVLDLLGVPVLAWIRDLFRKVGDVPAWAVLAGVTLETAQTSLAALAWLGILRAALPNAAIPFRLVLASYAVGSGAKQLPARQHRHLRDAGDVHDPDRRRDLHRRRLRPDRREDPLHGLQRRPLPLPLHHRQRLVLDQARLPLRSRRPAGADRRRRRRPRRPPGPRLLGAAGQGQGPAAQRRRDPALAAPHPHPPLSAPTGSRSASTTSPP